MIKQEQRLSALLRKRYAPPPMRPRDEFWTEFRRRAAPRVETAAPDRMLRTRWGWLAAAAALVLLAAVWGGLLRPPAADGGPGFIAGPDVDDVDVLVEHGSVIVLQDTQRRVTVVWVSFPPARPSNSRGG